MCLRNPHFYRTFTNTNTFHFLVFLFYIVHLFFHVFVHIKYVCFILFKTCILLCSALHCLCSCIITKAQCFLNEVCMLLSAAGSVSAVRRSVQMNKRKLILWIIINEADRIIDWFYFLTQIHSLINIYFIFLSFLLYLFPSLFLLISSFSPSSSPLLLQPSDYSGFLGSSSRASSRASSARASPVVSSHLWVIVWLLAPLLSHSHSVRSFTFVYQHISKHLCYSRLWHHLVSVCPPASSANTVYIWNILNSWIELFINQSI